jgi:hypothetical protein
MKNGECSRRAPLPECYGDDTTGLTGLRIGSLDERRYDFNMTFLRIYYALRDVIGLFPEVADDHAIDWFFDCVWACDVGDAFSAVGSLSLLLREPTGRAAEGYGQHRVASLRLCRDGRQDSVLLFRG